MEGIAKLQHIDAIFSIFEFMFEPWMDENDKVDFMTMSLHYAGLTFADLDRDISAGVKNGHTVEKQVEMCRNRLVADSVTSRLKNKKQIHQKTKR